MAATFADSRCRGSFLFCDCRITRLAHHIGTLCQTENIEDQGYAAIAEDCGPGICIDTFDVFTERLDHNLLSVADRIYHQAELAVFRLQYHDVYALSLRDLLFNDRQQIDDLGGKTLCPGKL